MENYRIKFSSIVLLVSGAGILFSLIRFEAYGWQVWVTAQVLFLFGLILLILKR